MQVSILRELNPQGTIKIQAIITVETLAVFLRILWPLNRSLRLLKKDAIHKSRIRNRDEIPAFQKYEEKRPLTVSA